ncbi:hypothetical protein BDV95DRAFT_496720 [Massariosphaeria phaeospora]|uniref:Uncharacterized protein n=1 Tax=Massariosphaeria phaeospora TaxID=100035 RepID=A0A7C8ID50_9PLEO|nr:hypothetical protein BDV95DRAFT_496720 [Massariosphaeria phaeospora]
MSSQSSTHAQDRRGSSQSNPGVIIRTSEPPESQASMPTICEALEPDGRPCNFVLSSTRHMWCRRHLREYEDLNEWWSRVLEDAESVEAVNPEAAKQIVLKLRLAVDQRSQIRERFYPKGGDTPSFIKWVLKLEKDVTALADAIFMANLDHTPTLETLGVINIHVDEDGAERVLLLQSPLDPRIPKDALQCVLDNGTILILKQFHIDLCAEALRRLYSIVPDLDDSSAHPEPAGPSTGTDQPEQDIGAGFVRSWFRIMILHDSEAEALQHATRSKSINEFLAGCTAAQLETYCDFFENAWRPHAVQYLRVAICAQARAFRGVKSIGLLGGRIPSTTGGLEMTKDCWDILYRYFPTLLSPPTLATICSTFSDYTAICKLLTLGLYHAHWFDPSSLLSEMPTSVYHGFIPFAKGDYTHTPQLSRSPTSPSSLTQRESRNYLCGQMALGTRLTHDFVAALRQRADRLLLVVYEGMAAHPTLHPREPNPFISRWREAPSVEGLDAAPWTTSTALEDLRAELRARKTAVRDRILPDSCQVVIVDRQAGRQFQLFELVQDTLAHVRRRSFTPASRGGR